MLRNAVWISILALFLAGCAGNQLGLESQREAKIDYTAPTNPPAKSVALDLNGTTSDVIAQLVRALDGPRFGITHVDERRGIITAVYRADPEEFIDCGTLNLTPASGESSQIAAASRRARYEVSIGSDRHAVVDRNLRLDGRMLISVRPGRVGRSEVQVSGDYVVTRTLRLSAKPNDPTSIRRELFDFASGGVGTDKEGKLKCQSNGELESYLLASLRTAGDRGIRTEPLGGVVDEDAPVLTRVRQQFDQLDCAPLNARLLEGRDVIVSGFVSSQEELDKLERLVRDVVSPGEVIFRVRITSQTFCEILDVTLPLKELNGIDQAGAFVSLADGTLDLIEGEYLVIDGTAPSFDSYVYLFYAQHDGKLIHILPNPEARDNFLSANERFRIGEDSDERRYSVAGPFGDDMVTMIASTTPLFPEPRPEIEATTSLADALADRVAAAEAAGERAVADIVFVRTAPKPL